MKKIVKISISIILMLLATFSFAEMKINYLNDISLNFYSAAALAFMIGICIAVYDIVVCIICKDWKLVLVSQIGSIIIMYIIMAVGFSSLTVLVPSSMYIYMTINAVVISSVSCYSIIIGKKAVKE